MRLKHVLLVAVMGLLGLVTSPVWMIWLDVSRARSQKRELQSRGDYPEVAAACLSLVNAVEADAPDKDIWRLTTDPQPLACTDPRVPRLLLSLSPRAILVSSSRVTLECHGGFDHYGFRLTKEYDDNPKVQKWTLSYYEEGVQTDLATVEGK